jgi:hypothetical protein
MRSNEIWGKIIANRKPDAASNSFISMVIKLLSTNLPISIR